MLNYIKPGFLIRVKKLMYFKAKASGLFSLPVGPSCKTRPCHCYYGYSHSLLDAKINSVLSLCHDQAILNAVQSIIQNMIACEDATQQQLSYLQSEFLHTIPLCMLKLGSPLQRLQG